MICQRMFRIKKRIRSGVSSSKSNRARSRISSQARPALLWNAISASRNSLHMIISSLFLYRCHLLQISSFMWICFECSMRNLECNRSRGTGSELARLRALRTFSRCFKLSWELRFPRWFYVRFKVHEWFELWLMGIACKKTHTSLTWSDWMRFGFLRLKTLKKQRKLLWNNYSFLVDSEQTP